MLTYYAFSRTVAGCAGEGVGYEYSFFLMDERDKRHRTVEDVEQLRWNVTKWVAQGS